ncbi:MAG: type II secretion system minor pseudopilin GspH [Gammaproteobacteria bacterium]
MKVNRPESGFTLIEVIVVIAIIGFVLTIATISIGDPQVKRMKQTSERFTALVQLAKEQAIFNSQEYALSVWDSGYAFYTLNEDGWVLVSDDRIFRGRTLPDGIEHKLYLDGIKVVLSNEDERKPQIFITSDGEVSPFQLDITDLDEWTYQIKFDGLDGFEIVLADA